MMTRVRTSRLSSPSCQPKLLSILIFLPIRQLIAREVNTISVKLTATVAERRSDIIKTVKQDTELSCDVYRGEDGFVSLACPLHIYLVFIFHRTHRLYFVCRDMRNTKMMNGLRGLTLAAPR